MNRVTCSFGLLILLASCQWVPGTDEHRIAQGEKIASQQLIDPTSALFRNSASFELNSDEGETDNSVCGEINGKNRNGAYVGYSRYIAVIGMEKAVLEPQLFTSDAEHDRLGKQCTRDAKGPFYFESQRDLALMTCERAKEAAQERLNLLRFELEWSSLCGTEDGIHLPGLVTNSSSEEGEEAK